ncbi:Uncharacterised protein [Chlamydia trachomatis]|nr:Uncharacterised protein [Chlamydia trachomatis]
MPQVPHHYYNYLVRAFPVAFFLQLLISNLLAFLKDNYLDHYQLHDDEWHIKLYNYHNSLYHQMRLMNHILAHQVMQQLYGHILLYLIFRQNFLFY